MNSDGWRLRARRFCFALAAMGLGSAAALGLSELGLRLAVPDLAYRTAPFVARHDIGFALQPKLTTRFVREDFSTRLVTNAEGFRGPWPTPIPGRRSVFFLGDSSTMGQGVEFEECFTEVFNRSLRAAGRNDWEGINFGMMGYATKNADLVLRTYFDRFQPAVVYLGLYENDWFENYYYPMYQVDRGYFTTTESNPGGPFSDAKWLLLDSYLGRLILFKGRNLFCRYLLTPEVQAMQEFYVAREIPDQARFDRMFDTTMAIIDGMDRYVRERDSTLVLFNLPSISSLDRIPVDYDHKDRVIRQRLQEHCRRAGIAYRSVYETLEVAGREQPVILPQDKHLNPVGHRAVGEYLASDFVATLAGAAP